MRAKPGRAYLPSTSLAMRPSMSLAAGIESHGVDRLGPQCDYTAYSVLVLAAGMQADPSVGEFLSAPVHGVVEVPAGELHFEAIARSLCACAVPQVGKSIGGADGGDFVAHRHLDLTSDVDRVDTSG
jgi:hypothetical protein